MRLTQLIKILINQTKTQILPYHTPKQSLKKLEEGRRRKALMIFFLYQFGRQKTGDFSQNC